MKFRAEVMGDGVPPVLTPSLSHGATMAVDDVVPAAREGLDAASVGDIIDIVVIVGITLLERETLDRCGPE